MLFDIIFPNYWNSCLKFKPIHFESLVNHHILPKFVCFAGENGAGKTKLLEFFKTYYFNFNEDPGGDNEFERVYRNQTIFINNTNLSDTNILEEFEKIRTECCTPLSNDNERVIFNNFQQQIKEKIKLYFDFNDKDWLNKVFCNIVIWWETCIFIVIKNIYRSL